MYKQTKTFSLEKDLVISSLMTFLLLSDKTFRFLIRADPDTGNNRRS